MNAEIREAANNLHLSLKEYPWFRAVGIGLVGNANGLIVYVSRDSKQIRRRIPDCWQGFAVSPEKIGQLVP